MHHRSFSSYSVTSLATTLGCTAAVLLATSSPAWAATDSRVQHYEIAPAPLGAALNQLGQQAHLLLSFPNELIAGQNSPGLSGDYTVDGALQALLEGSQLLAVRQPDGRYTLQRAPASAVLELQSISISGKAPGSTTEGTGLYTTYSSSSSTRLNLTPKETPQSLTVLTRQRLDDQRLTNLSDTLDATPGIIVLRDGQGAESDGYFSRGFEIQNFEIDGVPTVKRMDNYTQSMAMYDRVEVVRGATGLISGLGSPSATINLIRKRPTAEAQASVSAEAGSWDRYGTGFDVSGPLTETGNVRGRLVADFKTEQSWIDRYKQDSQLIYGITEFDLTEDTLLTMGFSYQRTDVDSPMRSGLPTRFTDGSRSNLKRSLNSAQTWSYNDHEQTSFFTSIEQQFANGWSGKIELTHSENKFDEVFNYVNGSLNPDGSGTTQLPVRFSGVPRQNNIDAYLTGPFDLLGREHELIAGVTLSNYYESVPSYGGWKYDYSGSPAGAIDNLLNWNGASVKPQFDVTGKSTVDETQYAAYLATRLHATDDLSILLGSRVIDWHREIEDKPYNAEHTKTKESETGVYIPYAGVVYDVNDTWSLYASYTKIFNPQSSWVRDINNKPLDPMEGTGYEVGVKGSHFDGKLNSSIALFKIEQDNLAIWIDTPGGNTYKSEQGTTTKGAEFTLDGELAEGWQASAGYAYAVSTDADDQRIVTTLPRHSLKTFTSYRLPGILDKVTLGGGVNWQSKTGADLHTFTQGSYAVTNLLARYDFNQHLSASVNLNNVFDREFLSYAGDHGMYGAPRNIMTGIKYTF
ncbi:TonB-dependent receptor [Pseudomonas mosselii]|uniref:TonB-dependent siderophore receptor n=1 Tax=Pseudomonas mosselii TaxID=78327 RepID=UPI0024471DF9|nr:TonB-dependent siderophore receptor [Pseudomonas mosselii]MDH0630672.1 TonB-dependent receptor [Pseudomonas mosselii]MDH0680514.1 TonB-dependent receptor [Pseudomonas mosselii]MDH0926426.1 TonB-dependent receptor [Pseudomonas mosselii]MDH1136482.1 TonB-dependent receptor [Pseudomonas mosselii]MDH1140779.1 TonB-dependent receptor [Pseudomonas mosselii]